MRTGDLGWGEIGSDEEGCGRARGPGLLGCRYGTSRGRHTPIGAIGVPWCNSCLVVSLMELAEVLSAIRHLIDKLSARRPS